ncbi:MAG: hypothetical protein U9R36_05810 [Elusimicrobiota bacterium]|nr:hypothetical protein [Elusimicrobiota bacterium]
MSYKSFIEQEFTKNNWVPVAESFRDMAGDKVLLFTHDDPDGLTAGAILKKLVEDIGGEVTVKLPPTYELDESLLDSELEKGDYDAVIVSDKGTMGYYDDYVGKVDKFIVIDHHPPIGEVNKCLLINPNVGAYYGCSASYMAHMLSTYLGYGSKYDDYLALVGLKGDWAVKPAIDDISDYVKDFYSERVVGTFDNLIEKIKARPTMFEFMQRDVTTLINQISELYFALGGGGFQYFYNDRDSELAELDHARFSFDIMERQRDNFNYQNWESLDDFIDDTSDPDKVRKIFEYFKGDWENTMKLFSGRTDLIETFGQTDIYKFEGENVLLMPMAGSIYNIDLSEKSGDKEVLFIMVNVEPSGGVHFSIRATSPNIHAGKICSNLAARLVEKFAHKDEITGGGHPFAAECKTRNSGVSYEDAIAEFNSLLEEMKEAAKNSNLEKAKELGLDYLSR